MYKPKRIFSAFFMFPSRECSQHRLMSSDFMSIITCLLIHYSAKVLTTLITNTQGVTTDNVLEKTDTHKHTSTLPPIITY